jgi:2-polyprenyl-6-methoxyphenol hydroxylase-like FAD-dependent oxidoreductase
MLPVAPGRRAGYISAVENGLWIASAFARAEDVCPRDDEGFLEWVAGLSHPVIHERLRESDPVSPKKICRMLSSRWRHYETMRDFPKRLVPLGDSFVSLNPMYGQGMTLAAHQALALRNALASHSCSGTDRDRIADTYFESCTAINQIGWIVAETRDLTFDTTDGPRPADIEDRWALQHGLSRLAEQDPDVQRLLVRMTHFLDPPSVLMEPGLVRRAMDASG